MTCVKLPRRATVYKKVGETPLMALNAWKARHSEHASATACYAGRLDPMAEGKLLLLFGDECKRIKEYTGLDKEYEVEILFGVGSDTGDVLGIAELSDAQEIRLKEVTALAQQEVGRHERPYPAYSSKTVGGKPLFLHALEGTLPELPKHEEHIYGIQVLKRRVYTTNELKHRVMEHLSHAPRTEEPSKVLGRDFRQDEIRERWNSLFAQEERMFTVITIRVSCASGTYMRSLAERLGERFGTRALALSITRTKIGKYWKGIWLTQY